MARRRCADVRSGVAAWVAAENKVTFAYLEAIPQREPLRERLTELWDYEKYSSPFKTGGRYYYFHNTGLQNQSVLFTMASLQSEPRVLIDPNTWSQDGTVALSGLALSDDGKYIAYGIQDGGSDWRTWKIMEIDSGKILDDELKWLKFSEVSWTKDGSGLFYCRYDEPQAGREVPVAESESEDLLSPRRYAAVGGRAGLLPARTIRIGAFRPW